MHREARAFYLTRAGAIWRVAELIPVDQRLDSFFIIGQFGAFGEFETAPNLEAAFDWEGRYV